MTQKKEKADAATRKASTSVGSTPARGRQQLASAAAGGGTSSDAAKLLKRDHRAVRQLFKEYESLDDEQRKRDLAHQICIELIVHASLEEELLYPACRQSGVEANLLDEAQVEHDAAKVLIAELMRGQPDGEFYDAKVAVLREQVKHHINEEEKSSTGILARARSNGVDMNELGKRLQSRKQELMSEAGRLRAPRPVSFQAALDYVNQRENHAMASQYDRERDEYGRFESDDRGGRGSYSRSRDDDYDGRSSGSRGRQRDEYVRFESDDRGGSGSYSRSREDDYDGRGSGSSGRQRDEYGRFESDDRGSRGAYGRSRDDGARQGERWSGPERDRYGRFESDSYSRSRDDDYDRRGSRSERDEYGRFAGDDRGGRGGYGRSRDDDDRDNGRSGWFGDSRRHAEAAREGWRNREGGYGRSRSDDDGDRDNGRSGWFGDSRRHAEAAREGWRNREGGYGRSRSDDDDRGNGGWFGDPRGHAEAAREGWRNRSGARSGSR